MRCLGLRLNKLPVILLDLPGFGKFCRIGYKYPPVVTLDLLSFYARDWVFGTLMEAKEYVPFRRLSRQPPPPRPLVDSPDSVTVIGDQRSSKLEECKLYRGRETP